MSSPRTAAVTTCLAAILLCGRLGAQVEVFSADAPEEQEVEPSQAKMVIEGRTATNPGNLPIPLDDTGFADWRFVNPRSPLEVDPGAPGTKPPLLLFINQTPDRIFEVTTRLSVNQSSFELEVPSTLPLLVYDAAVTLRLPPPGGRNLTSQEIDDLIKGVTRENILPIQPNETLGNYEKRLYNNLNDPRFGTIPTEILDLEAAIRRLAVATKKEKDARSALGGLTADDLGAKFSLAKAELGIAIAGREAAEKEVRQLRFGRPGVEDPDYLSKVRKNLIDELEARKRRVREMHDATQDANLKQSYKELFDFLGRAVEALEKQSPETSQLAALGRAVPSLRMADCSVADSVTCSVTIQIYPNGTNSLPFEVLRFQADPTSPAKFTLKFFGEEESPAKNIAYLVAKGAAERFAAPKSSTTLSAVASVGIAWDPFIRDNKKSLSCPAFCEGKPYEGAHRTHYPGIGKIEVVQTYGNLFDGKVSIGFKEGDLGQDGSLSVKLSQYRFNLYSQPGWTFHYGKYTFASPSSGIAINESGEGLRLAFRNYGLSRLIKSENTAVDNKADRDNEAWIFEATNLQVPQKPLLRSLRTVSVTAVYGRDKSEAKTIKFQDSDLPVQLRSEHKYYTFGGQAGFTAFWRFYGTVSAYRSKRTAYEKDAPCGTILHVCEGEGDVGLFTATRPLFVDDNGEIKRTVTFSWGMASGDNPKTTNIDEGYIGEKANYSPDQIFLSSIASSISKRNVFKDMDSTTGYDPTDLGVLSLGAGLSNKRYLGLKYVDNSWSLLEMISRLWPFGIPKSDIRSRSTTLTLNDYRLRRPLDGKNDAGQEADLEFTVETPRSVKVSLKGGYYWRGDAVEKFIHKDAWSVSAGISLSL